MADTNQLLETALADFAAAGKGDHVKAIADDKIIMDFVGCLCLFGACADSQNC